MSDQSPPCAEEKYEDCRTSPELLDGLTALNRAFTVLQNIWITQSGQGKKLGQLTRGDLAVMTIETYVEVHCAMLMNGLRDAMKVLLSEKP